MTNIFENGKFTQTTTYFDGWTLPEKERQLLIEFCEDDSGVNIFSESGANIFSEYTYDVGTIIDVNNAIEHGCNEEEYEEEEYSRLKILEVKAILGKAFEAGIDKITFYR